MKASELIVALQKAIEEHGDLPVNIAVPVDDDVAYMEVDSVEYGVPSWTREHNEFLLRE